MGGSGFVGGLVQGMQQAQDRQMQMAELKLKQDHAKSLQKSMEAEDGLKQLQLQALQRKMQSEMEQKQRVEALPGMQADVQGAPMGPNDFGPQPEIDRHKLTSLLISAQQAGQDPDQLLQLMSIGDPRIAAIRQTLLPKKLTKVGEGETLINENTGEPVAKGRPKAHTLAPGGSLVREGEETIVAPPGPPKPPDYGDRTESAAAVYGQTKFGKPMTFTELLATDPIQASKIRQQTMVEEPATIAAGKLKATIPEREAELLSPTEANELGVPFGTTKGEAKGTMPITVQQRAALAAFDTSRAIIADIEFYSEKVNKASGGLRGRAEQSKRLWGAWTQSDPDAALLQSKAGELAAVARSMGEKGALADKDVARAAALIPGVMDTREIAQKKLTDMKAIINAGESSFRKSLGIDARQPVKSGKSVPIKEPPVDPLASIPVPKGLTPQQEQLYRQAYAEEKAKTQQKMKAKPK